MTALNQKQLDKISKFLSFILRHKPEAIGLKLDKEGWAGIDWMIKLAETSADGLAFDQAALMQVVETNAKKRFEISADGMKIRAVQGHSTDDVARVFEEKQPPKILFHGTARKTLDAILDSGLLPMGRQLVHLSEDYDTAVQVGQRHGKPIVLAVHARVMHRLGKKFFQAENGVWLTESVAVDYIDVILRRPNAEQESKDSNQAE